jgi:hypothetical protein
VILAELATMRALVAGQVQDRSRESLDAVRAALTRLFDCFELVTHPLVIDDPPRSCRCTRTTRCRCPRTRSTPAWPRTADRGSG